MNDKEATCASEYEKRYVQAISRDRTIAAYADWMKLSDLEEKYLTQFINPGAKVLDLGCGTGRIPNVLKNRMGIYLGVDCSEKMIEKAKQLNPGVQFLCKDFLEADYDSGKFNVVLLMNNVIDMLHPVSRRRKSFELIHEVLSDSGVMICSSHLLDSRLSPGYFEENYHGATVSVYRSTFGQFCEEVETHGLEVQVAARDYRPNCQSADWAYVVASKK